METKIRERRRLVIPGQEATMDTITAAEIHDAHVYFSAWAQFGAAHWVNRLGRKWAVTLAGGTRHPVPFKSKRAAEAAVDAYVRELGNRRRV